MHYLSYLKIENFRVCKEVALPLSGFTPLVGQNNAGKSTILEAAKWVLKPNALLAADFADHSKSITITACIAGVTKGLLDRILVPQHRSAIEPYCANGVLWIRAIATGAGTRAFKQEVFDHQTYTGDGIPIKWRDYPTGLPQAVAVLLPEPLYIEAMDDIREDLGKAKAGTTIKELLDEIMLPVIKTHAELNHALESIRHILGTNGDNRSWHLKDFDKKATTTLSQFFPGLTLDLDLQLIDIKEFFKAGNLHVTDELTGDRRRFDQIGTGAQRAIQMALIRYLAETRSASTNDDSLAQRLLLIDEPELYLHPQGVRRLRQALLSLSKAGFQVVFSTHSPLMISRENAADTVIVSKNAVQGTMTSQPLRHAVESALTDAPAQSRTLFELSNIAEIYFAERVVLCEGKTDYRLLPLAYERLYGHPPELDRLAIVSLGGCSNIPKALPALKAMGIKTGAVADLDFSFTEARKGINPLLPKNDENIERVKSILKRIQPDHGFALHDNMPKNHGAWKAADVWALLAKEVDGQEIIQSVHNQLRQQNIWIWPQGCIENVTNVDDKGEDAILKQEEKLRAMNAADFEREMPEFRKCFDWIRNR